ncbi:MAG TPA: MFS transporter [Ktedonobacteraceae bacterium]
MNNTSPSTGPSGPGSSDRHAARASSGRRVQTFRALKHREFRALWISLVVSSVGTWIQIISQSLLVLKITDGSAFALGAVSLTQALSFFVFALLGGGLADRLDKRRLLLWTQSLSMGLACLLGLLTLTGVIQVWMIVLLAFCTGTVLSFDQPMRASLVSQLVPKDDLMNAISLQAVVFNGSAVLGPAIGGVTVGLFAALGQQLGLTNPLLGFAGNFFLNALSYLGILLVLYHLRLPAGSEGAERRGPMFSSIRAALSEVGHDRVLPWILMGYGALLFFGPSPALMLPYFAQNLNLSDVQLGLFFSATGLGTVLGALLIASLGNYPRKVLLLIIAFPLWGAALVLFAFSHLFGLSLFALLLLGIAQNGVSAPTITLLQTRVTPRMRGRVMSLNTLFVMGVRPLGDFPVGALIQGIGGPDTILLCTGIVMIYTLYLGTLQLLDKPLGAKLSARAAEE